jgi:hypothetical protein
MSLRRGETPLRRIGFEACAGGGGFVGKSDDSRITKRRTTPSTARGVPIESRFPNGTPRGHTPSASQQQIRRRSISGRRLQSVPGVGGDAFFTESEFLDSQ